MPKELCSALHNGCAAQRNSYVEFLRVVGTRQNPEYSDKETSDALASYVTIQLRSHTGIQPYVDLAVALSPVLFELTVGSKSQNPLGKSV